MSFLNHSSYTQSFSITQFWWRGKVLVQVYGHYQGLNLKNRGKKWKNLPLQNDNGLLNFEFMSVDLFV